MKPHAIAVLLLATFLGASFLLGASNLDELRTRAEHGDAAAQFDLGAMYTVTGHFKTGQCGSVQNRPL
jgi:hypothetical protein